MKVIARFMVLALVLGAAPALGVETGLRPTPAEMPRLPDYCQAKFNLQRGSPVWNSWYSRLGESFNDIHHYCAGLNYVNRYWGARSTRDKNFYLERAVAGMDYLVKSHKPDFPLRAEMYSNRGEVYKLMGRPGEAVKDLNQAVASDPRMVRPYLQLADIYVKGKSASRALETVSEGLRHVPDSTALQRRYLELGGQKPYPDPIVAKAAEPVPAQPETPASKPEAAVDAAPASAAPATAQSAAQIESPPAIGTPKNPYCRFCPPE
jgi:tetratricopeptide (TPR) repeat protein